ncbi:MAG: hypothetical protein SH857_17465 [Chitinophagales bacterium]|nr:hypothetical protein [Chitinophagales bacterium]
MKSRFIYKGPLALYVSYYLLFALAAMLLMLSFRVDAESGLFLKLIVTGAVAAAVSVSLILSSTHIDRKINADAWRKNAEKYYNDEGVFEYTHNGFSVITKEGKSLNIPWEDIAKIDSHEETVKKHLKVSQIDLYFTERDLLTVDSTMPGFSLFEKRLKGNMRYIWKADAEQSEEPTEKKTAGLS